MFPFEAQERIETLENEKAALREKLDAALTDLKALKIEVGKACQIMNVAGPLRYRVQMFKTHYSQIIQDLEKRLAHAEKRRDLIRQALADYCDWYQSAHEAGCPCDESCNCAGKRINEQVNAALAGAEAEPTFHEPSFREGMKEAAKIIRQGGYIDDDGYPDPNSAFDALRQVVSGSLDGVDVLEFMREMRGGDEDEG